MDILENESGNPSGNGSGGSRGCSRSDRTARRSPCRYRKKKKEYLFLMADFDNYRKRVTREKAEMLKNAGEKVLAAYFPLSTTSNADLPPLQVPTKVPRLFVREWRLSIIS